MCGERQKEGEKGESARERDTERERERETDGDEGTERGGRVTEAETGR